MAGGARPPKGGKKRKEGSPRTNGMRTISPVASPGRRRSSTGSGSSNTAEEKANIIAESVKRIFSDSDFRALLLREKTVDNLDDLHARMAIMDSDSDSSSGSEPETLPKVSYSTSARTVGTPAGDMSKAGNITLLTVVTAVAGEAAVGPQEVPASQPVPLSPAAAQEQRRRSSELRRADGSKVPKIPLSSKQQQRRRSSGFRSVPGFKKEQRRSQVVVGWVEQPLKALELEAMCANLSECLLRAECGEDFSNLIFEALEGIATESRDHGATAVCARGPRFAVEVMAHLTMKSGVGMPPVDQVRLYLAVNARRSVSFKVRKGGIDYTPLLHPESDLAASQRGGVSSAAARCFLEKQLVRMEDAYEEDAEFDQEQETAEGYRTKSVLCVPIFCEEAILGVAEFVNRVAAPKPTLARIYTDSTRDLVDNGTSDTATTKLRLRAPQPHGDFTPLDEEEEEDEGEHFEKQQWHQQRGSTRELIVSSFTDKDVAAVEAWSSVLGLITHWARSRELHVEKHHHGSRGSRSTAESSHSSESSAVVEKALLLPDDDPLLLLLPSTSTPKSPTTPSIANIASAAVAAALAAAIAAAAPPVEL